MELQNINCSLKMHNPIQFYQAEKLIHETELNLLKKKLATSSSLRLIVFLGIILGIYFFFNNTNIVIGITVVGISIFLYLILKHSELQNKRDFTKALISINKTEIQVLNNKVSWGIGEVGDESDVNRLFSSAIDTLKGIDILVANAGIGHFGPLEDIHSKFLLFFYPLNFSI